MNLLWMNVAMVGAKKRWSLSAPRAHICAVNEFTLTIYGIKTHENTK